MGNLDHFSYRKLVVYQHARAFVQAVYLLLSKYPAEEKYAICDQIRRSSVSIPSNIAEGCGRISNKEKLHFLEIAFSSLSECMCQLEISSDLGYITPAELDDMDERALAIQRMLSSLYRTYKDRV